ncbi:MAG: hypothetical protein JNK79_06645 [Chitinophagaceae bacterium]|nr:hypothetical protein [Chitinophagaceae bacterium]
MPNLERAIVVALQLLTIFSLHFRIFVVDIMKLIADIINELIDSKVSLQSPFLKTKVLARNLKNTEFIHWVDAELNGYTDRSGLPTYRTFASTITCSYANGNRLTGIVQGTMRLATTGYGKGWDEMLSSFDFYDSISALESLIENKKSAELIIPLSFDVCSVLSRGIIEQGNPFFVVLNASKQVSATAAVSILSHLRSKLLDVMLSVDEELGQVTDFDNLQDRRKINDKIQTFMQNNFYGSHGNIVNTGEQNNVTIGVTAGDFSSVEKELTRHDIAKEDIEDRGSKKNYFHRIAAGLHCRALHMNADLIRRRLLTVRSKSIRG